MLAERAVVGRHPHAVVRVGAGLDLVDQVAHRQRMGLGGAEDEVFSRWSIMPMKSLTR
jgi:hypothetical protein